jgi:hypothetical protein
MSWELALPGWALRVIQILRMRPYPDPRIVDLYSTGGGMSITFTAEVANYGTQQCRVNVTAQVGSDDVACAPRTLDLIPNERPQLVQIAVPRPAMGELVKAFNDDTTLYDQTLRVALTSGKRKDSREWHEEVYLPETNRDRYEIQQRVWRFGRGEETEADMRAEYLAERIRRRDEENEPDLYDV